MDGVAARCVVSIPGVVYLPFLYVLQGTAFAGAHVLFYNHGHTGLHVLGAVVVAAVVASPAAMYYALLRRVPECAEAVRDPRLQAPGDEDPAFPELRVKEGLGRGVYQACFGEDILVSVSEKWWVAEHYGVVFDRLRVDKAWFVGVEMARAVVLGLLSTWTPSSLPACDVRNFTLFAVLLTHLALLLWHRPYIAALTNVVNVVVAVAVAASMGAVVVGMALRHGPEDGAMQNGASLLWVATVCVQAKIVWDLGTRGYDIVSGRQRVVRRGWRCVRPDDDAYVECEAQSEGPLTFHSGTSALDGNTLDTALVFGSVRSGATARKATYGDGMTPSALPVLPLPSASPLPPFSSAVNGSTTPLRTVPGSPVVNSSALAKPSLIQSISGWSSPASKPSFR
eukprot:TRINITY_DN3379_c0_g1_i4.p1 TRINITY_DN3379_c0_g1~~TRINITY_DN3379_c0_g1_i4.p1  ORF type:complete len:416 (+),score=130.42 TRINITY_DN3379_c0_g1_i4:63-1250(+)